MSRAKSLAALAALCALASPPARAADLTLQGDRLALTTTGDAEISVATDSGLAGAVRIVGDDLACLKTQAGPVVVVSSEGCGDSLSHLTVMVPPQFGVMLSVQGNGDVRVGDVGALNATLESDGSLTVGRAQALMLAVHGDGDATVTLVEGSADIRMSASGSVKLARLQGILHAGVSGAGDLSVASIAAPAADISVAGSGDVSIGEGNISALRAVTTASGDVTVQAQVQAADLSASGGGDMKLREVSGVVKRHAADGSSIEVGGRGMDLESLRDLKVPPVPPMPPTINLSDDDWPDRKSHHSNDVHHAMAGLAVLGLLYFIWRTIQRRGGAPVFRGATTAQASHPGVLAVRDTLSRLEGRLAQVETYVTSREFDLQRKFRDLDKK